MPLVSFKLSMPKNGNSDVDRVKMADNAASFVLCLEYSLCCHPSPPNIYLPNYVLLSLIFKLI